MLEHPLTESFGDLVDDEVAGVNIRDVLTNAEFKQVTERSDVIAASMVLFDWATIFTTFWFVANWTNPLSILAAIFVLGGRQLGFGVLVHECGHRILFRTQWLNEFCGNWLAGYPIFSNKDTYMRGHLVHHQKAGTADDPDLANYRDYPIPRSRLRRKIWRDLSGQVGWRRMKSIGRLVAGIWHLKPEMRRFVYRSLAMNLGLLLLLWLFGHAWLYLLWVVAFMTSHMLVSRIRQIGEHAAVPDLFSLDPRDNTRTVKINWLERFFIAPHGVSYHLEHHLLSSVPVYRLRRLHELLRRKGFYKDTEFPEGYLDMLRQVTYPG